MTKTMTPQEYLEYLPAEYVGIAMDADGEWNVYKDNPTCLEMGEWDSPYTTVDIGLPLEYSGNWKDSWTARKLTFGDLEVGCEFWAQSHNSLGSKHYVKVGHLHATSLANLQFTDDVEVTLND